MPRFSANLTLLFRELPLIERLAAAREAGFGAAEIQVPYEVPAAELAQASAAACLPIVLINAPMGPDPSTPGIACRPEHRAAFRAALDRAAEYAQALRSGGATASEPLRVNVLAGRAAPQERAACVELLIEHLSLAARVLSGAGARPLLETINPLDAPGFCVTSFELAIEVLSRCDARVGLQFDIYHAARLGLDPVAAYEAVRDRVAHIQFADCPGRHEPGTGTLRFDRIFEAIDRSGYAGWVGAEYHPSGRTVDSLGWLRP
jgi:hydroxypyruvate isomerase